MKCYKTSGLANVAATNMISECLKVYLGRLIERGLLGTANGALSTKVQEWHSARRGILEWL
jgi:hypothetical protein